MRNVLAQQVAIGLAPLLVLPLVVLLVWLILRRIRRWIEQSIKARQDLARGVADISERLERLESKLGESQASKR